MSEFDDQVVRDQLQRLAGHYPDEDVAMAAMLQRVRVAKRRRAVVGAGGLCAVLVLGLSTAAFVNRDTHHLAPVASNEVDDDSTTSLDSSTSSSDPTTSASTSTTVEESTSTSSVPE